VAGIESLTQSTTVELRDRATGQVVGAGRLAHPATTPPLSGQDSDMRRHALADVIAPRVIIGETDSVLC
jgi:xylulokinase